VTTSRPRVSALIVSHNVRSHLLDTLRELFAQAGEPIEAVVVDNASRDGSAEAVQKDFPQVALISMDENVGFGRANNAGLDRCRGEFILLLNPDVLVQPGCVRGLADFMSEHPDAGAAGPRIERPDGGLDLAARRSFPSPSTAFYRFSGLSRLFPRSPRFNRYNLGNRPADELQEIDSGSAACLMVRRSAIDKVGFFDPDYFMYGEDLDLCFRLKAAGWKIFYVPSARALHLKGSSTRQATGRMLFEFHRAMWIFYRKRDPARSDPVISAVVWAGIWSRWAALSLRARLTGDRKISR
jgi:GT2 family glycosyltransferase